MRRAPLGCLLTVVAALGCGHGPSSSVDDPMLDGRTYILKTPAGYDGSRPLPLVVAMHGYGATADAEESYFGLDALADQRGFFVVYPNGTVDAAGRRFFTATDACCDFYDTGVDDVAFIGALLDHLESRYAIDASRVYATGHSNGGFMSYRLACDLSSRFAAIVSLEGAMWNDPTRCKPSAPVAVLEVHGADDAVILPGGGNVVDGYPDRVYPPLAKTLGDWATYNGCSGAAVPIASPGTIDSESPLPTTAQAWTGCKADVELWLNEGGTHIPKLTAAWAPALMDFLLAHSRSPAASDGDAGPVSQR